MTFARLREQAMLGTPRKVKRAERKRWIDTINAAQAMLGEPIYFAPLNLLRAFGIVYAKRIV